MENSKVVYLTGLNGLRAIAAISVVIGHVTLYPFSTLNLPRIYLMFDGVTLFFVISGFLITYLLLAEKEKTATVKIDSFYVRRILRIWPIYYLVLAISAVFAVFVSHSNEFFTSSIFYYLFFCANIPLILNTGIISVVHYWSIGVEEQFYLFWPWVLKYSKNKLLMVSLIFIAVFFAVKTFAWYYAGENSVFYQVFSVTRFHCMLIGAVGAILYYAGNKFFIKTTTHWLVQFLAWLLVAVLYLNLKTVPEQFLAEFTAIVSLVLIMGQVAKRTQGWNVINLENNVFDFLGKISYGIYVIHPLVIFGAYYVFADLQLPMLPKSLLIYSVILFTTIVLSYISYQYFEKPFLKMKDKFTVVKSSNTKFVKAESDTVSNVEK